MENVNKKTEKKFNIDWKKIESNTIFTLLFTLVCECLIEIYLFFDKPLNINRELFSIISIFIIVYFFKSFAFDKEKLNRFNLIKILFSFILMTITAFFWKTFHYAMFGYIEIVFITLLTSLIINKKPKLAKFLNALLMLLFNLDVIFTLTF